jgi:hypothetical protein
MSTSLLYHAFGIRCYNYVRTDSPGGQVIFANSQDPQTKGTAQIAAKICSKVFAPCFARQTGPIPFQASFQAS